MCNDIGEGSRCCAAYSIVGAIFTLWVGIMISSQPFFIAGIEDADQAKSSAFGAFAMFVFTFILSALGIWHDSQNKAQPMESEGEYALATDEVPNYGTSS